MARVAQRANQLEPYGDVMTPYVPSCPSTAMRAYVCERGKQAKHNQVIRLANGARVSDLDPRAGKGAAGRRTPGGHRRGSGGRGRPGRGQLARLNSNLRNT